MMRQVTGRKKRPVADFEVLNVTVVVVVVLVVVVASGTAVRCFPRMQDCY